MSLPGQCQAASGRLRSMPGYILRREIRQPSFNPGFSQWLVLCLLHPSSDSIRSFRASSWKLLRAQQAWTCVKIPTSAKLMSFHCLLGSLGDERRGMPEKPRNQSTSVSRDVTGCAVLAFQEPGDRLAFQEKGHPALHGILA